MFPFNPRFPNTQTTQTTQKRAIFQVVVGHLHGQLVHLAIHQVLHHLHGIALAERSGARHVFFSDRWRHRNGLEETSLVAHPT